MYVGVFIETPYSCRLVFMLKCIAMVEGLQIAYNLSTVNEAAVFAVQLLH